MARIERMMILRTPPFVFVSALTSGLSVFRSGRSIDRSFGRSRGFSIFRGLLISGLRVKSKRAGLARNQVANLSGRARQIEARLRCIGERVDAAVARGGDRILRVVDLDRIGDTVLET